MAGVTMRRAPYVKVEAGDEPARPLDCPKCAARVEAEVADLYGGECPACGHRLDKPFNRAFEPLEVPLYGGRPQAAPSVAVAPKIAPVASVAKPDTSRQIKCVCSSCGWTMRAARSWIGRGLPTCHCGGAFVVAA